MDNQYTNDQMEEFEERAAIMQYMGHQTKEQAEANAWALIKGRHNARHTLSNDKVMVT